MCCCTTEQEVEEEDKKDHSGKGVTMPTCNNHDFVIFRRSHKGTTNYPPS